MVESVENVAAGNGTDHATDHDQKATGAGCLLAVWIVEQDHLAENAKKNLLEKNKAQKSTPQQRGDGIEHTDIDA